MAAPLDEPMRRVVVVGGGIVGWSAAAALRRRLPSLDVTIVPVPPPADALADRVPGTLPSAVGFHDDLGLRDEDAVIRAGSFYRLGTAFEGWAGKRPSYVHAYGAHGHPFGTASFHHHWVRAAAGAGDVAPFDTHSPAAALARAGRFAPPINDASSPFAGIEHGLVLDIASYTAMLSAFARHVGVAVREGIVRHVRLRADGFVDALLLDDGSALDADLFVDTTGPRATIRAAIDGDWEDWSQWLPADRLLIGDGPPRAEPSALDRAIAMPAGWRWVVEARNRTAHGMVYASADLSTEAAARAFRGATGLNAPPPVTLRQGTRPEPWRANCVAIGDAATCIEPLEWTNLHLAHSAIDRVIAMMPGRACHPLELADYNRQAAAEVARVRDFAVLHYATANRPELFWQRAAAAEPPASLAYTLRLFAERGRLPFFEEETFAKDSWLSVLIGQGVIPRRTDPLIDTVPAVQSDQAMAGWRAAIMAALPSFPTPAAYLGAQKRQISA